MIEYSPSKKRRNRRMSSLKKTTSLITATALALLSSSVDSFVFTNIPVQTSLSSPPSATLSITQFHSSSSFTKKVKDIRLHSSSVLDRESVDNVDVKIDRTSANSRRISGDIIVPCPIDDVWAILTDYDNLSIHVPNLVESQRRSTPGYVKRSTGRQGDGSYSCRLHQKGAQRIIGFKFGASLLMDMTESIALAGNRSDKAGGKSSSDKIFPEERKIGFRCIESQFFSEFDGEWKVESVSNNGLQSNESTKVSYVVDVRPRGPVPVIALEWRIKEDVPTNLLAVKKAAQEVGLAGVLRMRGESTDGKSMVANSSAQFPYTTSQVPRRVREMVGSASNAVQAVAASQSQIKLTPVRNSWYEDETMGKYLDER